METHAKLHSLEPRQLLGLAATSQTGCRSAVSAWASSFVSAGFIFFRLLLALIFTQISSHRAPIAHVGM